MAAQADLDADLRDALLREDLHAVASLVARGADPRQCVRAWGEETLLARSVRCRDARIARALLAGGADPDGRCGNGMTAVHYAANFGALELLEIFAAAGADLRSADGSGRTPWDWAEQYPEVRKALGRHGAGPRDAGAQDRALLESMLRSGGETEALALIRARPASVRGGTGTELVESAALRNRAMVLRALLEAGAVPDRSSGETKALGFAIQAGAPDPVQELLLHGASADRPCFDAAGALPVEYAFRRAPPDHPANVAIVDAILAAGSPRTAIRAGANRLRAAARRGGYHEHAAALPPGPLEVPLDPAAFPVRSVSFELSRGRDGPRRFFYSPNDVEMPFHIDHDLGRDGTLDERFAATGMAPDRAHPLERLFDDLPGLGLRPLETLVLSWAEGVPLGFAEALAALTAAAPGVPRIETFGEGGSP